MRTSVLRITPDEPEPALIAQAGEVLRAGGLVAFPTETVYGLGANALDAAAVARVFAAKGRPANNPIIVHVADVAGARGVVAQWPSPAGRLAARFWPGPLTLVLPRRAEVPSIVTAGGSTVAVRMPAHPVALALLRSAALPVAAPSANRSSQLSPTRAEHVLADLDGRIDLLLDAGPTNVGLESTVLDVTANPPRVLRPGHIKPSDLVEILGFLPSPPGHAKMNEPLRSPGLLARHYAPQTPLECCDGEVMRRVEELRAQSRRVACLLFAGAIAEDSEVLIVRMPTDPVRYAARLYEELHRLDAAGVDCIVVEMPPNEEAWLAVRDRLLRMTR